MVQKGDLRARDGRVARLEILLAAQPADAFPAPALALEYYEEARFCWLVGAYISTIVMTQMALEELLRAHYRAALGVTGVLPEIGQRQSRAGFASLTAQAAHDGVLTEDEAECFDRVRSLRNPYVHARDSDRNPDFFRQAAKITAPGVVAEDVADEARTAITFLVHAFAPLARRLSLYGDFG